jgi:glycosyltransferase involved in cell wall biosynthesis
MLLSVIICSFNPKKEYLDRTLDGLRKQTLPFCNWELIIVDNASSDPIKETHKITWQPNVKYVYENQQGLIFARIKGISEANCNLLVFFDDDNIPDSYYLENVLDIAEKYPFAGVFGGNCIAEYETTPPEYLLKHTGMLAVRTVSRIVFSNLYIWNTTPTGAGMVVRKNVADCFIANVRGSKISKMLGRRGNNLMSGEDNEISYTAIDMGFACGLFPQLSLIHIIPNSRLQPTYLLKLSKYIAASTILLNSLRPETITYNSMVSIRPMINELKRILRFEKLSMKSFWFEWRRFWNIRNAEKLARTISLKISND